MLGAMSDWVYNRNPTESLHFEEPLRELKADLASGKKVTYLPLVGSFIINNSTLGKEDTHFLPKLGSSTIISV